MISTPYGLTSEWDKARLRQQNGDFPEPHKFLPDAVYLHMCSECFATIAGNKPWHIS
jgi:hypothetical protein